MQRPRETTKQHVFSIMQTKRRKCMRVFITRHLQTLEMSLKDRIITFAPYAAISIRAESQRVPARSAEQSPLYSRNSDHIFSLKTKLNMYYIRPLTYKCPRSYFFPFQIKKKVGQTSKPPFIKGFWSNSPCYNKLLSQHSHRLSRILLSGNQRLKYFEPLVLR